MFSLIYQGENVIESFDKNTRSISTKLEQNMDDGKRKKMFHFEIGRVNRAGGINYHGLIGTSLSFSLSRFATSAMRIGV